MNEAMIQSLYTQNRLLKITLSAVSFLVIILAFIAIQSRKRAFTEIDVERINIVTKDGRKEMVISNRNRLPQLIAKGESFESDRHKKPGMLFYNEMGDECGGLIYDGKIDSSGKPNSGMHFSMDRFAGDQQLALGHYENGGMMQTGLTIYDRGLLKDYAPLQEAMKKLPDGPEKSALKRKWEESGGRQTPRIFVGKTKSRSSALVMADAKGKPRIMMTVSPEGKAELKFLDGEGKVVHSLTS